MKLKINYWEPKSTDRCISEIVFSKELTGETKESIFLEFYKLNNSLRYCNGSHYTFEDTYLKKEYDDWYKNLDKKTKINLFYCGTYVD